ncbi:MAG: DUF1553 domain-containing protein, partial [Limisphaerales bacterium]
GPGRADNGNIGLSRIRVFTSSSSSNGSTSSNEVRLSEARATFEQNTNHLAIAAALDSDLHTGWAVDPRFGTNHAAAFAITPPIPSGPGRRLTVVLEFQVNTRHNIGRARLAVASDPATPLEASGVPSAIAALLAKLREMPDTTAPTAPTAPTALSASERKALLEWWKPFDPGWKALADAAEAHRRRKPRPALTKVLTCTEGNTPVRMHTQGADFFPETHFLDRGSADRKQGVATQGFPEVLARVDDPDRRWAWTPPQGARYSGRRRALANWITDADHGAGHLLARVIVNRVWQHHFGRGLVATPNDFGAQGSPPTHPELLDWLAAELIRREWRLKPIHELILTSAAYQLSTDPPSTSEADSIAVNGPESYRAFIPRRLQAEAIRDSILFVSGTLDPTMYGPGTLDPSSTRRSIYFTVKRSQLIPALQVFDAPEPLVSQGTRPSTTVAPQALLLMNSPQLRHWAEKFARRIEAESESDSGAAARPPEAVRTAYRIALGREPTVGELSASTDFLTEQTATYEAEVPPSERPRDARRMALTDLAQAILSLNEFIYVD